MSVSEAGNSVKARRISGQRRGSQHSALRHGSFVAGRRTEYVAPGTGPRESGSSGRVWQIAFGTVAQDAFVGIDAMWRWLNGGW